MTFKNFLSQIVHLIESGDFIYSFSDYIPSKNKWKQWSQVEYWIHIEEKRASESFLPEFESVMDESIKMIIDSLPSKPDTPFKRHLMQFVIFANVFFLQTPFKKRL